MPTTLYEPGRLPRLLATAELPYSNALSGLDITISQVASLLQCAPGLVDVLAQGSTYTAFSIFDYEGALNLAAMQALSGLTDLSFDPNNDDEALRGSVLIVTAD